MTPSKTYRRPRRRPAHLRTKTGCLTCRRRRKKCDETEGACLNCSRRGIACDWLSDHNDNAGKHQNTTSLRDHPSEPSQDHSSITTPTRLSRAHIYSSALTPNNAPLFDFLRVVFLRQLIQPTAHRTIIEFFNHESITLALHTPFYMHALLACCGAEIPVAEPDAQAYFQNLAQSHYVHSLAALRDALDHNQLQDQEVVITRTVLTLCIYERSRPCLSPGVDAHLLGLAQLIQRNFAPEASDTPPLAGTEAVMRRLILEAFLFHATTSIPFQKSATQPEIIGLAVAIAEQRLERMVHVQSPADPESPVLGVPAKLFVYAREISLIYEQSLQKEVDVVRCHEIGALLSDLAWDITGDDRLLSAGGSEVEGDSLLGPKLYIIASRLLLHRMTHMSHDQALQEMLAEGIELVRHLQPSTDYYAEYYCWPIRVFTTFVTCAGDRDCLLEKVVGFWRTTRNGTMKRLVDMLSCMQV